MSKYENKSVYDLKLMLIGLESYQIGATSILKVFEDFLNKSFDNHEKYISTEIELCKKKIEELGGNLE